MRRSEEKERRWKIEAPNNAQNVIDIHLSVSICLMCLVDPPFLPTSGAISLYLVSKLTHPFLSLSDPTPILHIYHNKPFLPSLLLLNFLSSISFILIQNPIIHSLGIGYSKR
ncbi:unnamed protein product [Sphenostylis stenocarpa]|uniref:Uncharacterized protein n=1 Tax=Sphenostylis stenocarpa TaxID=92480 RepID=A0AA86T8N2_9FABA|nr:unnamed protein product [Sphenostylis stenocarpa]